MFQTVDPSWFDQDSSWWVKANRANEHLGSLRRQVEEFRASEPYSVTPELTAVPGRLAYVLRILRPFPTGLSATVGDVLSNLRSALESLAFELALRSHGRVVNPDQERASSFPIRATPDAFDQFFATTRPRGRVGLYDDRAREAFRDVQPFRHLEEARRLGVAQDQTFENQFRWNELYRLDALWNIDKHRRLALMAWWPALTYWMSDGPSNRRALPGDGTRTDGSVLLYLEGRDEGQGAELSHEFDIVLTDDPAYAGGDGAKHEMLDMLEQWHMYIIGWVFPRIFTIMSGPSTTNEP